MLSDELIQETPREPILLVLAQGDDGAIEQIGGMTEVGQAGGRVRYVPPVAGQDHIFDATVCAFKAILERRRMLGQEYDLSADVSELGWTPFGEEGGGWKPPWE